MKYTWYFFLLFRCWIIDIFFHQNQPSELPQRFDRWLINDAAHSDHNTPCVHNHQVDSSSEIYKSTDTHNTRTPAYSCTILHTSENQWLNIHPDFSNALLIKRYSLWRLCRAATLALLISVFFTPSAWRQGAEMRSIISGRHRLCCHANSRQTDSFLICCCSIIGFGKNAFHQTTDKVSLKDELLSHSDLRSVCSNPMEWWENIWV